MEWLPCSNMLQISCCHISMWKSKLWLWSSLVKSKYVIFWCTWQIILTVSIYLVTMFKKYFIRFKNLFYNMMPRQKHTFRNAYKCILFELLSESWIDKIKHIFLTSMSYSKTYWNISLWHTTVWEIEPKAKNFSLSFWK